MPETLTKQRRIESLTPDQAVLVKVYQQRYRDYAYGPIKRWPTHQQVRKAFLDVTDWLQLPKRPVVVVDSPLAVTGHKHRLTGGRVVRSGSQTFAVLDESQRLVHEEHTELHVPKGVYEVVIQREYVESSERRVTD